MSAEDISAEKIWADDLLGRQADAEFLKQFLVRRIQERSEEGRKQSYVLNLDAGWGHGKTFFLTRFRRELEAEGYLAAYVNAWEDDHAEDPLLAVMSAIDAILAPRLRKKSRLRTGWEVAKRSGLEIAVTAGTFGLKKLIAKGIGEGVGAIEGIIEKSGDEEARSATSRSSAAPQEKDKPDESSAAKALTEGTDKVLDRHAEEALKRFRQGKSSIASFKSNLAKFLRRAGEDKDIEVPLFVLVDELDRCRPTYAISLLERVKHLFEIDNVVFVIATDSGQLRHAIKAVYGESFESGRYLLRFFDRSYHFEDPSLEAFSASMFERFESLRDRLSSPFQNKHEAFFSSSMRYFGLSLRDAEQCFDHLRTVSTIWSHKTKLELVYLLPLIVAFQQGNEELFSLLSRANVEGVRQYLIRYDSQDWKFELTHRTESSIRAETATVSFSRLLMTFLSSVKGSLDLSIKLESSTIDTRWVSNIFQTEFALLHNNSYNPSSPPMSLTQKYPEMVRNAGRIVATA